MVCFVLSGPCTSDCEGRFGFVGHSFGYRLKLGDALYLLLHHSKFVVAAVVWNLLQRLNGVEAPADDERRTVLTTGPI